MGESGNAYKVALMLELAGCDWEPVFVDFFGGETRTPRFRSEVNELGEVPVLEHRGQKISQSGAILHYLAELTGRYMLQDPVGAREVLRWILFDNHKFSSYYATLRYLVGLTRTGDPAVIEFLRGRVMAAFGIVDRHLAAQPFLVGVEPTIADLSLCGYLYYREETGVDLGRFPQLVAWTQRIAALPGWQHPYDLLPRGLPA
jgi:glutathione S-transferase